jgi:kynureninase
MMNNFEPFLNQARELDAADPLGHKRDAFSLPAGMIYLDGNSLGALPKAVCARMQRAIEHEWGQGLISSWNAAAWYTSSQRVGAQIARLIGADPAEVVACDSTSVNLFKVLSAACAAQPQRSILILEEGNFPTDAYIGQAVAKLYGKQVVLADQHTAVQKITEAGSALCAVQLTQVHYKTGRMLDMAAITQAVHAQGARMVWDLAHSAGAVKVDVQAARADYAVGCGYKYLNGGPGAPAFAYVRSDHLPALTQPLQGWFGHAAPFAFTQSFEAAPGIEKLLTGTTSVLAMTALEESLKVFADVDMAQLRLKSESLTELFIALYDGQIAPYGLGLATPRQAAQRGSQVSFTHAQGYAMMQALIERGVVGDFRAPDILRFGFAPLYLSHADVVQAAMVLQDILHTEAWRQPRFAVKNAVT